MLELAERIAIVTGSGQGIGRAIALELARRGARIVTNDMSGCCADDTLALVRELGSDGLDDQGGLAVDGSGAIQLKPAQLADR